jgi:Na+/melibiose symporter-like transporter
MWFSYLVLFFHKVVELGNTYAGMLILIGQLADALATPIIGFLCDKTHVRYGRRKLWHLIGTVMVAISFFFFWHTCLGCSHSGLGIQMVYFSIPIIIFQFGWASVQISHLSLIPELTDDKNERVGLNAIRYIGCPSLFRWEGGSCRDNSRVHPKGGTLSLILCSSCTLCL